MASVTIAATRGSRACARAGIDDADLAAVAGHAIDTMLGTYTHPLGPPYEQIRAVIGRAQGRIQVASGR